VIADTAPLRLKSFPNASFAIARTFAYPGTEISGGEL
jgi:hypothetical protein